MITFLSSHFLLKAQNPLVNQREKGYFPLLKKDFGVMILFATISLSTNIMIIRNPANELKINLKSRG